MERKLILLPKVDASVYDLMTYENTSPESKEARMHWAESLRDWDPNLAKFTELAGNQNVPLCAQLYETWPEAVFYAFVAGFNVALWIINEQMLNNKMAGMFTEEESDPKIVVTWRNITFQGNTWHEIMEEVDIEQWNDLRSVLHRVYNATPDNPELFFRMLEDLGEVTVEDITG